MDFTDKRITVTGGKGFLGKHLITQLNNRGCKFVSVADLPEYNLTRLKDVRRMYREKKPDIVIHLAAKVGGIGFNQQNPASLFYENAMMGIQLMHEGYINHIDKFVALGTICAYPKFTPVPFKEDNLWGGYPEETNAPYGLAKKMMLVQSQAYRQQYGFNSIFLLPVNLYGPGDNFSFTSSHVIPALLRKFHLAQLLSRKDFEAIIRDFLINKDSQVVINNIKIVINKNSLQKTMERVLEYHGIYYSQPMKPNKLASSLELSTTVEIWGTGRATREFFYVGDAAEAIVLASEKFDKSEPVNIGAGFEISIKDLVMLIVELMNYKGKIVWDTTKPDGQPRRMLDTRRASREFGFIAKTDFREGLKKTIEWYNAHERPR